MPQIALPLGSDPALTATALPAQRLDPVGFRIGWDHARHGVTPPVDDLHLGHPVRQGWEAGRAAGARRPVADTQAVRRWLGLRLMAWRCGREVDEETVTLREVLMLDVSRASLLRASSEEGAAICSSLCTVLTFCTERAACPASSFSSVSISDVALGATSGVKTVLIWGE
jgi:hypothetical protein